MEKAITVKIVDDKGLEKCFYLSYTGQIPLFLHETVKKGDKVYHIVYLRERNCKL